MKSSGVFLILDRNPVNRAAAVKRWLERNAEKIRVFFLPSYSPELNPDKLLNQDVNTNVLARRRPTDKYGMIADVRGYMRSTQRKPLIVKAYFYEAHVQYAAA